ncbi:MULTISPECIES: helix-turn-helix transcriptional regulator [Nocardiaceae]|uniref:Helix-turn-helix transcriptional regulator n=1 Tax=Rhodococcoides yunnanense TaxID=278209 RepID=A0ABU4B8M7_9NOCA|nr:MULTISPECIES: helix-turn-helix transcriptional regulator [Rhodococcus]MDI9893728.1 helix-turn-helix transcriptional regulator [Rhodococcus sp. IEGM 1381]MDV6260539.1 helix-turn-helix transcriptional regulator [Rhodococcus yunnanensis]
MSALLEPLPSANDSAVPTTRGARGPISLVPPAMQIHPVPASASPFPARPDLTGREIEVLLCWIKHDSKTEVAKALFLSLGTVNTHLTRIRAKYTSVGRPAPTKAGLVARALQDGLVDISEL